MKDKIEIAIKTLETEMENLANSIEYLEKIQSEINTLELMPQGTWDDINDTTPEKRCSNCGRVSLPTIHCIGCGSKNVYRQKTKNVV